MGRERKYYRERGLLPIHVGPTEHDLKFAFAFMENNGGNVEIDNNDL